MDPLKIDITEINKIMQTLELSAKYDLALLCVESTIPIWENYTKDPDSLSYYDGVGNQFKIEYQDEAGNLHNLERDIISKTIQIVREATRNPTSQEKELQLIGAKLKAHSEAIDIWDSWQPFEAETTLLAAHNLVQLYQGKFNGLEEAKLDLIIQQAVKAIVAAELKTISEMENLLRLQIRQEEPSQPDKAPTIQ